MITSKIQRAAATTEQILGDAAAATAALKQLSGRIVNGWGVFTDPQRQVAALREAHAAIGSALERATAATWPSNRDYEQAEE